MEDQEKIYRIPIVQLMIIGFIWNSYEPSPEVVRQFINS